MQYLCLFYGSNNAMYTNHCKDDLTGVNPADHVYVPRYPCRSFCVQVMLPFLAFAVKFTAVLISIYIHFVRRSPLYAHIHHISSKRAVVSPALQRNRSVHQVI